MQRKLIAIDMDGTLLRSDGVVSPKDSHAISEAMRAGVHVVLCTGRVASGALPTARSLSLTTDMVCADGGVIACPSSGAVRSQQAIALAAASAAVESADRHGLAPFVLLHSEIHGDASGERFLPFVRIWTETVSVHERLSTTDAWRRDGDVAIVLGVGPKASVDAMLHELSSWSHALDLVSYRAGSSGDNWAVMARPFGVTKATGLAKLAATLGVAQRDVCAVGDWFNDVPMLQWAGVSYAMGQSPDGVRMHAKHVLAATSKEGGGVAEALGRWL